MKFGSGHRPLPFIFKGGIKMNDLYTTDERGRNIYHVYNLTMPSGSIIRSIKYDFGTKGHGIALVARDCLDALGYKYAKCYKISVLGY